MCAEMLNLSPSLRLMASLADNPCALVAVYLDNALLADHIEWKVDDYARPLDGWAT